MDDVTTEEEWPSENPRHPLDRPAGGVSPELQAAIDEGKFAMPIEQREAFDRGLDEEVYEPIAEAVFVWDDPLHPGFHYFSHSEESAKQAHAEGLNPRRFEPADWPFLDDPPDPL